MNCLFCQVEINNNRKFCSQSCSGKYMSKQNRFERKKCLACNNTVKTLVANYCSQKCFANHRPNPFSNFNNNVRKNKRLKDYHCKSCNILIKTGYTAKKYCANCHCSDANKNFRDWTRVTLADLKARLKTFQAHARIRELSRAIYIKSGKPKHCVNPKCVYRNHYEVCHIKPIGDFSGDTPVSVINDLSNLIALCPNCHWDLDHNLLELEQAHEDSNPE